MAEVRLNPRCLSFPCFADLFTTSGLSRSRCFCCCFSWASRRYLPCGLAELHLRMVTWAALSGDRWVCWIGTVIDLERCWRLRPPSPNSSSSSSMYLPPRVPPRSEDAEGTCVHANILLQLLSVKYLWMIFFKIRDGLPGEVCYCYHTAGHTAEISNFGHWHYCFLMKSTRLDKKGRTSHRHNQCYR